MAAEIRVASSSPESRARRMPGGCSSRLGDARGRTAPCVAMVAGELAAVVAGPQISTQVPMGFLQNASAND
jgi:hypothetical protein